MKKIISISSVVFVMDQLVKILITSFLDLYETKTIIPAFFSFTRVNNDGAAFSILSGNVFFLCVISIVSLFLFYYYFLREKNYTKSEQILYGLFLGGTFGNLFDRIFRGYVIDYLDFKILGYNFPIFNFADIAITISIIIIVFKMIKEDLWKKQD